MPTYTIHNTGENKIKGNEKIDEDGEKKNRRSIIYEY